MSVNDKEMQIATKVGETAVRAFVEKLKERCELHWQHPERSCDEHNPEECFGVQMCAVDLLEYAESLLPKEEKEAI